MISVSFGGSAIEGLKILDVRVNQKFNTPQNPLEDGTPIIDHKVRLPKDITVVCCVPKGTKAKSIISQIQKIRDAKLDKSQTATIVDAIGESHSNMILVDYGNTGNATEKFDNYFFDLKFKEFLTSTTKVNATVAVDPDNSNMTKASQ